MNTDEHRYTGEGHEAAYLPEAARLESSHSQYIKKNRNYSGARHWLQELHIAKTVQPVPRTALSLVVTKNLCLSVKIRVP
jgi:hypothetical protein